MKFSPFVALLFTIAASNAAAADTTQQQFSHYFSHSTDRPFSGDAIIARGNQSYFSYSSLTDQPDTQFVIGSLSKQFTAALVLQQIEAGTLKPDQSIRQHLPTLPEDWGDRVTIANLLNHTSGAVRPGEALAHPPGSAFRYSNWGYDLLAQAAEKVSGQRYAQLASTLFNRCALTQSFAPSENRPAASASKLVEGYFERELGNPEQVKDAFPLASIPSGGVVSSAADLVRWNHCLYSSDTVASNIELMVKPTSTRKHRWGDIGYGAGLQISQTAAGPEHSHSGYVLGYISTMSYYPKYGVSLVILENVAWNPKDMKRVFGLHDRVRNRLVEQLSSNGGLN